MIISILEGSLVIWEVTTKNETLVVASEKGWEVGHARYCKGMRGDIRG